MIKIDALCEYLLRLFGLSRGQACVWNWFLSGCWIDKPSGRQDFDCVLVVYILSLTCFISSVSNWDLAVMAKLSRDHGISVHRSCVNYGFDWRSGELKPDLVRTNYVKERNLVLAGNSFLTYFKAQQMRCCESIPTKEIDYAKTHLIRNHGASESVLHDQIRINLFMMPPDIMRSCYINTVKNKDTSSLRKRTHESAPPVRQLVDTDSNNPSEQQNYLRIFRLNVEQFHQQVEQQESGQSDSEESDRSYENEFNSSDDEDN